MPRTVSEWIGKTPDTKCPLRVRVRIFTREGGKCHACGQPIHTGEKWEADHRPALINGGENRESMMFPVHRKCHQDRTRADVAEKAKVAAVQAKHIGAKRPAGKLRSAPFPKPEKERKPVASAGMSEIARRFRSAANG